MSGLHLLVRPFGIGEGDEVITSPFNFIASSNCILYERAKPVFVDIEPDTANIDPSLIGDAIVSRYVIRVGVDEPTPERQSAVRDHVMRRFQEAGIGCRPYFTPIHLQPFYAPSSGPKEGDFHLTEFAEFAESAGHTSIAVPFHNRLRAPGRRGDRLRRRRPRACAGGVAVGSASTPSRHELLPPESPESGQRAAEGRGGGGRPGSVMYYVTCPTLAVVLVGVPFHLPRGIRSFVPRRPRQLKQPGLAEDLADLHAFKRGELEFSLSAGYSSPS